MKKLLVLLVMLGIANAEPTRHKVKSIEACVLGNPSEEIVRICIDDKRYGIFYETGPGYGWYIRLMFFDSENPASKCSCNTYEAQKAKMPIDKTKIRERIKQFEQNKKIKKLDTDIICVKC